MFRRKLEDEIEDKFDAIQIESELKHKKYTVSAVTIIMIHVPSRISMTHGNQLIEW